MKTDPALDAVRKARTQISHEFGNDPSRLVAHYAALQAEHSGQVISGPGRVDQETRPREEDAAQQGVAD